MRIGGIALAASLIAGCYLSHSGERRLDAGAPIEDAGRAIDAPLESDAGSFDRYWVPVDALDVEMSLERCEMREGQTLIVRAVITTSGCDEPGNAELLVDHRLREVFLSVFVWRPMNVPSCPPFTREIVRDVALDPGTVLGEGDWMLIAPDSTTILFVVQRGPPELTCTDCIAPGMPCAVDTECEGLRACVALRGDAICAATCEMPCQPFDGSESDLACTQRLGTAATCTEDPNLGFVCAPAAMDLCPPCPEGQSCRADADAFGYCEWSISPWDGGGTCAGDRDCLTGFSCVEMDGSRMCRIRCHGDHPCPFSETCASGAVVCPTPKI